MIKRITKRFTPKQYLAELLLGLTALLGLYLIVAWSSYTPLDNSWSTASFQTETINKAGAFGAWLIDAFFVFLGYVGHLIPFVIFIVPIYLLKTKAVHSLSATRIALRSFGFIALIVGLTMDGHIVAFKYELLFSWRRVWWQLSSELISYTRQVWLYFSRLYLCSYRLYFLFRCIINSFNCEILSLADNEKSTCKRGAGRTYFCR